MIQRCENPKNVGYKNYGARGVTVCPEWHTFENFYADVGDPPFEGACMDRKRNNEGYKPGNVRWVTRLVNNLNRRNTLRYEYQGQIRTLHEIAQLTGKSYMMLYQRLKTYNWTPEKAFNT